MGERWTVRRARDLRRERWSNGLGWTSPILCVPDVDSWDWRLSLAESDLPAEFSPFPGVGRELVLLEGTGLCLRFGDGEAVVLRNPGESARFSGIRQVIGEPVAGPTKQLNAMWRTERVDVSVTRLPLRGSTTVSGGETAAAVVVLTGSVEVGAGGSSSALSRWDALLLDSPTAQAPIRGDADLVVITVRPT